MSKKYLIIVVALLFALSIAAMPAQAAAPTILLNGQTLQSDTPPVIEDGSTLVPMRVIFEALGAKVAWDGPTKTVKAVKGDTTLEMVMGGDVKVNGQKLDVNVQAKIYDGSTMVPLRLVGEYLGAKVNWNQDTQTVTITIATDATAPEEPTEEKEEDAETQTPDDTTVIEENGAESKTPEDTAVEEEDAETGDTATDESANGTGDAAPQPDAGKTPFSLYLESLEARFVPEKAEGVSTTYQFIINEGNEGNYYAIIKNGEIATGEGTADSPTITITVGEQLWLDIASGKVDGTLAYFEKKFAVDGDPMLIKELQEYFAPL